MYIIYVLILQSMLSFCACSCQFYAGLTCINLEKINYMILPSGILYDLERKSDEIKSLVSVCIYTHIIFTTENFANAY